MTVSPTAQEGSTTILWIRDSVGSNVLGETAILLHPPPYLSGVSIGKERERQQNDRTLAEC